MKNTLNEWSIARKNEYFFWGEQVKEIFKDSVHYCLEVWLMWIWLFLNRLENSSDWVIIKVDKEEIIKSLKLLHYTDIKMIEWRIKTLKDNWIDSEYFDLIEDEISKIHVN